MEGLPLCLLYLALGRHLYEPTARMAELMTARVRELCERGDLSEDHLVHVVWASALLNLPLEDDTWRAVESCLVAALAEGSLIQQVYACPALGFIASGGAAPVEHEQTT
jgi:hypothetical protein